MTHNCLTHEYKCHGLLLYVYTNIWKDSAYFMYFNFGTIEIHRLTNTSISVKMHIRDNQGNIAILKSIIVNKTYFQKNELCMRRITERREWNFFLTQIESIVRDRSIYLLMHYYAYYMFLISSCLTILVWTIARIASNII